MSLRAIAILLIASGLVAAAVAWGTNQLDFVIWLKFTLVAFAAVYLFSMFKNRARVRTAKRRASLMAGQAGILDDPEVRARWSGFAWTDANAETAKAIVVFEEMDR